MLYELISYIRNIISYNIIEVYKRANDLLVKSQFFKEKRNSTFIFNKAL